MSVKSLIALNWGNKKIRTLLQDFFLFGFKSSTTFYYFKLLMQLMLPIYRNLLVSVLLLFHSYILHVIIICNLLNRIQLKTWSWNHSFYPLIRWRSNDNYQHNRSYLQISWIKRKTKFDLSFPICSILTVIKITIFLDTLIRK